MSMNVQWKYQDPFKSPVQISEVCVSMCVRDWVCAVLWLAVIGDLVSLARLHWLKHLCADCKLPPYGGEMHVCVCVCCSPCWSELRLSTLLWFTTSSCCLDWKERERERERVRWPVRPAPSPRYHHTSFVKWKQSASLPKYFYSRLLSKQRVCQKTKGERDHWTARFDATAKLTFSHKPPWKSLIIGRISLNPPEHVQLIFHHAVYILHKDNEANLRIIRIFLHCMTLFSWQLRTFSLKLSLL